MPIAFGFQSHFQPRTQSQHHYKSMREDLRMAHRRDSPGNQVCRSEEYPLQSIPCQLPDAQDETRPRKTTKLWTSRENGEPRILKQTRAAQPRAAQWQGRQKQPHALACSAVSCSARAGMQTTAGKTPCCAQVCLEKGTRAQKAVECARGGILQGGLRYQGRWLQR